MQKTETTTKKIKLPNTEGIREQILNSKYTKIAIGTIGILATVIAVGGILKIVNYTIMSYKDLKITLKR